MGFLKKVERHGRFRVVYVDYKRSEARRSLLVPFSAVSDLVGDEQEQEALPTHLACNEAVANFGQMLTDMLKGIVHSIEEVTMIPKDLNIEIVTCLKEMNDVSVVKKDGLTHAIFRVTLANKEEYAIDLTGAQYGHQKECLPWQHYTTSRVERIVEIQPSGAIRIWLEDDTLKKGFLTSAVQPLKDKSAKELGVAVERWAHYGGDVNVLLASPEGVFEAKRRSLLETVKNTMEFCRNYDIEHGSWLLR
ncbi:MAG: hypothetical protein Q9181_007040 [Wetmoreana brouardii]